MRFLDADDVREVNKGDLDPSRWSVKRMFNGKRTRRATLLREVQAKIKKSPRTESKAKSSKHRTVKYSANQLAVYSKRGCRRTRNACKKELDLQKRENEPPTRVAGVAVVYARARFRP